MDREEAGVYTLQHAAEFDGARSTGTPLCGMSFQCFVRGKKGENEAVERGKRILCSVPSENQTCQKMLRNLVGKWMSHGITT